MEEPIFNEHNKIEYPPMHTAEHILNQTMIRMFGCKRSFSSHLERKKSKCDYHFDRALTAEEEKELERRINEAIALNMNVTESVVDIEEAKELVDLEKLPDNASTCIRIIRVGDYDVCACLGVHVKNTSEIGKFVLTTSTFENGILRIRFKLNENTPDR